MLARFRSTAWACQLERKLKRLSNDDVVVAVKGVEQVLLRAEALFGEALESINPGFSFSRVQPKNACVEALKSGCGDCQFSPPQQEGPLDRPHG